MKQAWLAAPILICAQVAGQNGPPPPPPPYPIAPATLGPVATSYTFITRKQRLERWVIKTVGPSAIAEAALATGIQTMRDSPYEWDSNMRGFGQRAGWRFARLGISNTIELGVSSAMREDPRYFYSQERGFGRRLRHAVVTSFLARKPDGSHTFATGRFAGKVGGAFIANTWYPPSNNHKIDALERIGTSMGFTVGFNVLREFGRDLRKKKRP